MEKQEKGGKSGFSVGEKESSDAELGRLLSRGRPDLVGRENGIELVASIAMSYASSSSPQTCPA